MEKLNSKKELIKVIHEKTAKELVKKKSIEDKGVLYIKYLGIKLLPYKTDVSYKCFPDELKNKKVYVFEGLYSSDETVSIALCRYYVTIDGDVYKDTFSCDGKCIKVYN